MELVRLNVEAGMMSMVQENRRVWQRHLMAENRRNLEALLENLCADPIYKIMATSVTFKGPEQVRKFYADLFEGVPDANFELVNSFVGEEGAVAESILRGAQHGFWLGVPPTGREIALPMSIVVPMMHSQILGERLYFDLATLARQLSIPVDAISIK
jgi:carboxymethylenebutenolidase